MHKSSHAHIIYFWFKYNLGQKYQAPQVRPDRGSNLWPPDHDSTFHVTETPALTTQPLVTSMEAWALSSAIKVEPQRIFLRDRSL